MKNSAYLILILLTASCSYGQTSYEWKATEHIIDESGNPVFSALAIIGYYTNSISVTTEKITGTNGLFEFQHAALSEGADVSFEAKKEGYYSIWQQTTLQTPYDATKWSINKTLVLKKIKNPTAMYAKSITGLRLPELNKTIGYDLELGDWDGPYGKGIKTDLFFTEKHTDPNSGYIISISFPKAGDGIQEFTVPEAEKGSGLRSPHEAPVDGYQKELAQTEMTNPNRNFYFRVRTILDKDGKVVSAHYGKIYGDLAQFTYYLNPTPNNRNIEFDPKQNLIQGLQSFEQVTAP